MGQAESNNTIRPNIDELGFSATLGINERVKALRSDGVEILHLGFGESPFPVHPIIQMGLIENSDKNMYLPTAGLSNLRRLAGEYFADKFGMAGQEFKTIIGPGSKALIYALQMSLDGDLLLPVPSWVSYRPQAKFIGDKVVKIPTNISDSYHITATSLEKVILDAQRLGRNPKKLILNYPNNPTGLSVNSQRLAELAEVCRRYQIIVISDEIYGLVHHRQEHRSIAGVYPEGTVVTSGLSKHLSLGGYRVGVALIPIVLSEVFDAVVRIASETWSTVPAPIQYAVVKAFQKDPEIEAYIRDCTRIHSMVSGYFRQVLLDLGIDYPPLDGGFYLYPDFSPFRKKLAAKGIHNSLYLSRELIEEIRVATLPGTAFGDQPENLTLRLAVCDYDGAQALEYYQKDPECSPDALVKTCCPNIKLAGERFGRYFSQ